MKRTAHAKLVRVGSVDPLPPVVDKHATWGRAFMGEAVERDLAGMADAIDCDACGVRLQPEPSAKVAWRHHEATRYHQRNVAAAER